MVVCVFGAETAGRRCFSKPLSWCDFIETRCSFSSLRLNFDLHSSFEPACSRASFNFSDDGNLNTVCADCFHSLCSLSRKYSGLEGSPLNCVDLFRCLCQPHVIKATLSFFHTGIEVFRQQRLHTPVLFALPALIKMIFLALSAWLLSKTRGEMITRKEPHRGRY